MRRGNTLPAIYCALFRTPYYCISEHFVPCFVGEIVGRISNKVRSNQGLSSLPVSAASECFTLNCLLKIEAICLLFCCFFVCRFSRQTRLPRPHSEYPGNSWMEVGGGGAGDVGKDRRFENRTVCFEERGIVFFFVFFFLSRHWNSNLA